MTSTNHKVRHVIALLALSLVVSAAPVIANTTATALASMTVETVGPSPQMVVVLGGAYESAAAGGVVSVAQVPSGPVTADGSTVVIAGANAGGTASASLIDVFQNVDGAAVADQSALSVLTAKADLATLRSDLASQSQTGSQSDENSGRVMILAQFN